MLKEFLLIVLRSRTGFTLIELMVVVAIVGILSAIAIPNYSRYQAKSRQAEAKIALASIYGGEKAFYAEYSAYQSEHGSIGYVPEGTKRFYSVGWTTTGAATVTGFTRTTTTPNYAMINYPASWTTCDAESLSALPAGNATDNSQTFTVGAAGQLNSSSTTCDEWEITETKRLTNTTTSL